MAKIIPVPVEVSLGVPGGIDGRGEPRFFGKFAIVPYATARNGELEVARWMVLDADGYSEELNERMLFSVMPLKLLDHVLSTTFENEERDTVDMIVEIDGERWSFPMRARELEDRLDEVHYEIQIYDEWFLLLETFLDDILSDEQFAFAEREVLPCIDFGHAETVMSEMY